MVRTFDFEKLPIVEIANEIIIDSVKRNASDIHFDPYSEFLKIRIRIDGELIDYSEIPNIYKRNLITRIKIIAGMNITESRLPQDGAIKSNLQNLNLDLRVSSLPTNKGEKIVIRILDYSMSSQGLEYLGFSEDNFEKVQKMISVPNGIVLVTGATGSGKSTTVYSILQRLNKEDINIMTVEDPIEMDVEGINQIQVNSDIGLTFANVLRSILRQDPNIIMIGEIRDTETAQIAVRASITGHLVLSTIHTNNSLNTIERLLDMDVERYLLGTALTGIISQKLARKLCETCKQKHQTTEYEKEIFQKVLGHDVNEIYVAGSGCSECNNGYRGRIAIQEVLLITEEIKDAIVNNIRKEDLRNLVYNKTGTVTMLQDGLIKVVEGITSLEEILKLIELEDNVDNKNGIKISEILNNNKQLPKLNNNSKINIFDKSELNSKDIILEPAIPYDVDKNEENNPIPINDNTEDNNLNEDLNQPIDFENNFISNFEDNSLNNLTVSEDFGEDNNNIEVKNTSIVPENYDIDDDMEIIEF